MLLGDVLAEAIAAVESLADSFSAGAGIEVTMGAVICTVEVVGAKNES